MYITGCLTYGSFCRSGRIYVDARNILHGVMVQVACPCTVSSLGTGIDKYIHVCTCQPLLPSAGIVWHVAVTVSIILCPGQTLWAHTARRHPTRRERFITWIDLKEPRLRKINGHLQENLRKINSNMKWNYYRWKWNQIYIDILIWYINGEI